MHTEMTHAESNRVDDALLTPPSWCVVRRLPNSQYSMIAQFDSRTAAEEHLQFLTKMAPDITYDVVFDFGVG